MSKKYCKGRGVGKVCRVKKAWVGVGGELECPLDDMFGI